MQQHSFRIIGGQWRGRRFSFPPQTSVRPTGDRVRETLFNWLQPYVEGAKVLDLFAGSGALGMEALSRGAAELTAVEKDRRQIKALKDNLERLEAGAELVCADVLAWLPTQPGGWDLLFLDPPYPLDLWLPVLDLLAEDKLSEGALIYTEQPSTAPPLVLPSGFEQIKARTAGQLRFMLLRYNGF